MGIQRVGLCIRFDRMIALIFFLLGTSSAHGPNSNDELAGCHSKPCWMNLADAEDQFRGEPYDYDEGKAAYLVRQKDSYRSKFGKYILSERKIVTLGYRNLTSDLPMEILFSPPGTVGWIDYAYVSLFKGPPANALAIHHDVDYSNINFNTSVFLCRPKFPSQFDSMDVDADPGLTEEYDQCWARFGFCGQKNKLRLFYTYRLLVNPLEAGEYDKPLEIHRCTKTPEEITNERQNNRLSAVLNNFQDPPGTAGELETENRLHIVPNDLPMPKVPIPTEPNWDVYPDKGRMSDQPGMPCWMDINAVDKTFDGVGIVPNKVIVRFGKQQNLKYFGEYDLSTKEISPLGYEPNYIPGLDIEILYLPPGSHKKVWSPKTGFRVPSNALQISDGYNGQYVCVPEVEPGNEFYAIIPNGTIGIVDNVIWSCNARLDLCQRNPKVVEFRQYYVFVNAVDSDKQTPIYRCAKPTNPRRGPFNDEMVNFPSSHVRGDDQPYDESFGNGADQDDFLFDYPS